MHVTVEPAILYFGTPVVLIGTVNENGGYNLAPMSSAFWLGWRGILGLAAHSKTPRNMMRTGECVLNLPSSDLAAMVDRLALTTGSDPVPPGKLKKGYRFEADKFGLAGFTPVPSETVSAPRVLIMSFQKFYGLDGAQPHPSTLARIPEALYRGPDIDRSRDRTRIAENQRAELKHRYT